MKGVEVRVCHYRSDDEIDELPQNRSVESVVKRQRQQFTVRHVRATIERMHEDSDEELAEYDDEMVKGDQAGGNDSEHIAAAKKHSPVMTSQRKRKLLSSGHRYGSVSSGEDDENVELSDSPDDFINQLTTKLQTFSTAEKIHRTKQCDRSDQTSKNKLSQKKTAAANSNPKHTDSRNRQGANSTGTKITWNSRSRTQMHDHDPVMPAAGKSSAVTSKEIMEDMYRIESLSDSGTDEPGEPLNVDREPMDMQSASKLKTVEAKTAKYASKVTTKRDKKKQTSVHQQVKPSTRPNKVLKYCDALDAAEDIVEADDSDVEDEEFHSLTTDSPVATSEKDCNPSKKLTSAFWLTSPVSEKSVYHTDDEFVSTRRLQAFVVTQLCFC